MPQEFSNEHAPKQGWELMKSWTFKSDKTPMKWLRLLFVLCQLLRSKLPAFGTATAFLLCVQSSLRVIFPPCSPQKAIRT